MQNSSPFASLNTIDWYKALRGLFVILLGGALSYLVQWVAQTDFGTYQLIATAISSTIVELGRRFLTDYARKYNLPVNSTPNQ